MCYNSYEILLKNFSKEDLGMWSYIWPILLVIASNTFYHISAKSTPSNAQPFLSLVVTYLTGAIISTVMYFATRENTNIINDLKSLNWTSLILGLTVVGLEYGYIQVYRAGWDVSVGSLVANIGLAMVLFVVGVVFFKEPLNLNRVIGLVICIIGIIIINKN